MLATIEEVQSAMEGAKYITDRSTATVLYLSLKLGKPILVEGEAGVGKTEIAKVLAQILATRLIRLQCYEGLDVNTSLYEWNYPRQILWMKQAEICELPQEKVGKGIFSQDFLIRRPLLEAILNESAKPPVLLIDEIDRSDEEFEAFLLEVLSDFQVTIPEIGTLKAKHRPHVILTSNRTRELHDALKRRCLYHWIDYPSLEKERRIVLAKVPGVRQTLLNQVCLFMQRVREKDLFKRPGIAETLDWVQALMALGKEELDAAAVRETSGCIFKYYEDLKLMEESGAENLITLISRRDDLTGAQIPCA
ncbi:MAG: MoxR family ATPase [Thermodesulfobacteriota bacterium]|jgi:MoxR-like ATPase